MYQKANDLVKKQYKKYKKLKIYNKPLKIQDTIDSIN